MMGEVMFRVKLCISKFTARLSAFSSSVKRSL